jgi:uncharacterized membrane protein YdjX (TVP38/TMEM64 family)
MPVFRYGLLIILFFLLLILLYLGMHYSLNVTDIQTSVKSFGVMSPIIFLLIFAVAPLFFVPVTPLMLTAGILFGPVLGTVLSIFGATIGASLSFFVSRYFLKNWIDQKSPARVLLVQEKIKKEGWKFIVLARITPIFPFNVQNYIFGVTNVSIKTYFWASLLSLIPGCFTYVYLGYAGISILQNKEAFSKISVVFIIILLIVLLPKIFELSVKKIINMKRIY